MNFESLVQNIYLMAWPLIFSLAISLLCLRSHAKLRSEEILTQMRYAISISAFAIGGNILIEWLLDLKTSDPDLSWAITISMAYFTNILLGVMLLSLIDERFVSRQRVRLVWIIFLASMAALWGTMMLAPQHLRIGIGVVAVISFCNAIYFFLRQVRSSKQLARRMDEYYSTETQTFNRWIFTSSILDIIATALCVVGSIGALPPFSMSIRSSVLLRVVIVLGSVVMFVYLFVGFLNFALRYKKIDLTNDDVDLSKVDESKLDPELQTKAENWVKGQNYLLAELNADEVAAQMGVKRSELLYYTHKYHETSFREWVFQLRLEEAKKMLKNDPKMNLADVAEQTGFASKAQFVMIFTKQVGVSPERWVSTNAILKGGEEA